MNTATIAAPSNVTPFAQNLNMQQTKQQTAKEAIAASVQALIEQLEQGHSEGLTAYLTAMGRFHFLRPSSHLGVPSAQQERLCPPTRRARQEPHI
jgi:hypothetical protein